MQYSGIKKMFWKYIGILKLEHNNIHVFVNDFQA